MTTHLSIVGMACRFPGAKSVSELHALFSSKSCAIRSIPADRGWTEAEFVRKSGETGHTCTAMAGYIDEVDRFDCSLFQISPKEAEEMDPNQRISLEVAYEALLDAGLNPFSLKGSNTGVFVGAGIAEYMGMAFGDPNHITSHTMTGNSLSVIANRISYVLDLKGPSLTTDTACSSSMTALHLAAQSLLSGECDRAIVVGVNTLLGVSPFIGFTQAQMLSPSGTSRPFDQNANGFVRGEGCGAVVLSKCKASRIYASLRASGINQDGKTKSMTMPSEEAQAKLMMDVLASAKASADDVAFVEAHGTGTKVGDPIEAHSIAKAVGRNGRVIPIGSAKGHLGHLETASGIVGVIKAALSLYHGVIYPTAGHTNCNLSIETERLGVRFPIEREVGNFSSKSLILVNSYGFGGSNGVALLQPAECTITTTEETKFPLILALSSHFQSGISQLEAQWLQLENDSKAFPSLAANFSATRPSLRYRRVFIGASGSRLSDCEVISNDETGQPSVIMAFGGQGSHFPESGCELYALFPVFKATIQRLSERYSQLSGIDLIGKGFCTAGLPTTELESVLISVPSIIFVQMALVQLYASVGIQAQGVVAHSTGEIVSAFVAGCITEQDVVTLTFARAFAQHSMKEGAMAAWAQSAETCKVAIENLGLQQEVEIGCVNAPAATTLSGTKAGIEKLVEWGKANKILCTILPIRRAYHSVAVAEIENEFASKAVSVPSSTAPTVPMFSSVLGTTIKELPADYWWKSLRQPVLFSDACSNIGSAQFNIVLEVSPTSVLSPYLKEISATSKLHYVAAQNKKKPSAQTFLSSLAELYCRGASVDWTQVLPCSVQNKVMDQLPCQIWEHKVPLRSKTWRNPYHTGKSKSSELGSSVSLNQSSHAYLLDHKVGDEVIFPGAGYVSLALKRSPTIRSVNFSRYLPLFASGNSDTLALVSDGVKFGVQNGGIEYMNCELVRDSGTPVETAFEGIQERFTKELGSRVDLDLVYAAVAKHSALHFGKNFRLLQTLTLANSEALATVAAPESDAGSQEFTIHPALLDACFQVLGFLNGLDSDPFVPHEMSEISMTSPGLLNDSSFLAHAKLSQSSRDACIGDIDLYGGQSHQRILTIRGMYLGRAPSATTVKPSLFHIECQPLNTFSDASSPASLEALVKSAKGSILRVLAVDGPSSDAIRAFSAKTEKEESQTSGNSRIMILASVDAGFIPDANVTKLSPESAPKKWDLVLYSKTISTSRDLARSFGNLLYDPVANELERVATVPCSSVGVVGDCKAFSLTEIKEEELLQKAFIIDTRGDIAHASRLLKLVCDAKSPAKLVYLITEESSPLWGFTRAARNEEAVDVYALGISSKDWLSESTTAQVLSLLADSVADRELHLVQGEWRVPRIQQLQHVEMKLPSAHVRLAVDRPGQLSGLAWHPIGQERLRPNEVLLETRAVSLHFKDVMVAMGMLGKEFTRIGNECSGIVREIGSAVTSVKVGDRVVAAEMSATGSRSSLFATAVTVRDAVCVKVPEKLDLVQAAGFVGVMGTAWYALVNVGRIQKGDVVLISSALGGVGQSALQICKLFGATVIASAGSASKRERLQKEFGVQFVFDSHNPSEYYARVMSFTNGRGVDLALNSVSGAGQAETLKCMAPEGRFLEIGKADIIANNRIGLGALKQNVSFHSVHLDLLGITNPGKMVTLFQEMGRKLHSGELHFIESLVLPATRTIEAFQLMASGKHSGKIIVEIPPGFAQTLDLTDPISKLARLPHTLFDEAKSVLITGGTRGLGLALARWVIERGAFSVVVVGTSSQLSATSELSLKCLKRDFPDALVTVKQADLTDTEQVLALVRGITPPIGSIFHAANVYSAVGAKDAVALDATWQVKVKGATNLFAACQTVKLPLDLMLLFGSLAGLHGNIGQCSYVCANASLASLAQTWRSQLPVIAVDFPIMVGAGRLSEFKHIGELNLNVDRGFGVISWSRVEEVLTRLCVQPLAHPAHVVIDAPNWLSYKTLNKNAMFFDHFVPIGSTSAQSSTATSPRRSLDPHEVKAAVWKKIAFVLGASTDDLDGGVALSAVGVDSLAAVELSNWAKATYGTSLTQTAFLSGLTPNGLLQAILDSTGTGSEEGPATEALPTEETKAEEAIFHMPASPCPANPCPSAGRPVLPTPPVPAPREPLSVAPPRTAPARSEPIPVSDDGVVLLPQTLRPDSLSQIGKALGGRGVLVFRGDSAEHFCLGMDLSSATFGTDEMSEGLEYFAQLYETLAAHPFPVITVCHGATRGGGMLFPCVSTVVLAVKTATFGFPEIRQGGLPGVVSVAAQNRMSKAACQRWMLTGDEYTAKQAKQAGLVDFIGTPEEVEAELKRLLGRFKKSGQELLTMCKQKCPAPTVEMALLAMGALDKRDRDRETPETLVRVEFNSQTGVAIVELNDPSHCNAIDWAISDDLRRAINDLKTLEGLRAVVLQGAGNHFCVGVNPYNFIRRTKSLPIITTAQITYEIYRAFVSVRDLGVPVIAAVHGKVVGGGLAAMLNADYRFCDAGSIFNYGNLPRGVCPGLLLSHNLGMTVGHKNATELYMNDVTLDATQSHQLGLINEVCPTPEATKMAAYQYAVRLASYPVVGVRNTLALMRPPIDELRLSRECVGMARCNKKGNAFRGQWKVEANSNALFNANTPTAAALTNAAATTAHPAHTVQSTSTYAPQHAWQDHQKFVDEWTSGLPVVREAPKAKLDSVFLTGSTGFLGCYIVRDLVERGVNVIGLARAQTHEHAVERIVDQMKVYGIWKNAYKPRIKAFCGNLDLHHFGLSDTEYEYVRANCDCLIHNGAEVNFSAQLDHLLKVNVGGTRTAIELAAAGRMRLLHVSSLGVFSLHRFVGNSSQKRPDPRILINGYARSKWLAEQVVWQAAENGLSCAVVRPGRIMGDSVTGACNVQDWFCRYLAACIQLGLAWAVDHNCDMTHVDLVSLMCVETALKPEFENSICKHAISKECLTSTQIHGYLRQLGYSIRAIPVTEWLAVAGRLGKSRLQPLLDTFRALPIEQTSGTRIEFSSDMGPAPNGATAMDCLVRMVSWLQSMKFIPMASSVGLHPRDLSPDSESSENSDFVILTPKPDLGRSISPAATMPASRNVGILALELYTPNHSVKQADLEVTHNCPGKYTVGLLQEQIGFCGEDEDAVSMALTVCENLLTKHNVDVSRIGRVEVGTESLLDRSKSIKSHLMQLFAAKGCYDMEGVDNYNACYGGTAALLNSIDWASNPNNGNRLAVVVCVDIADLNDEQAFLNGASAVALLVGPDAALVLEPERASYMMHTWDFYKPVGWKDAFPLMRDGKHSIDCYMQCLDGCAAALSRKLANSRQTKGGSEIKISNNVTTNNLENNVNLVKENDYFVFHCTSTYLCKRGFKRLCDISYPAGSLSLKDQLALYTSRAEPSTWFTKRIGSSYTASCYTNLYSLLSTVNQGLVGKSILVFSYGSGSASSMYRLHVRALPAFDPHVVARLDGRVQHQPPSYLEMISQYSATYGKFGFKPKESSGRQKGVWYLANVDEWGIRSYSKHE